MSAKSIEGDIWELIAVLSEKQYRDAWDKRPDEIRALLANGADPNVGRGAPLTMAVKMGHLEVAKVLIEYGADIHGGCRCRTPLVFAAGKSEIREYLIRHGACETIFTAAAEGDVEMIRAYVKQDDRSVHLKDEEDMTPLFFSGGRHDLAGMKVLLEAGADPNAVATTSYGVSPLHSACVVSEETNAREVVSLLVEYGADVNAQNKGGVTALHMSVRNRNAEAVRGLLEHGADPNMEDKGRKSTPLRRAVANTGCPGTAGQTDKAIEIVKLLLASGADPGHVNRTGKSVINSTRNETVRALLKGDDMVDFASGQ